MRPVSALAQVYFRRGLKRVYGRHPDYRAGLSDLEQAASLQSSDPCYAYHLGLAAHRLGDADRAVRFYRKVLALGGAFAERAAYPLAVAFLQRGEDPT
jgi:tetratricopeptide (TPR) repeat protein